MHEVPAGGRIGFRRHAAQIRRQLIDRPVRLGRTEQNDVRIDAKPRAVFVVAAFRIVELNAPSIALLLLDGSQSDSPGDGFAIEQAADNPLVLCERLPTQCQRPDLGRVQHNDPRPPAGLRQSRGQRVSRGTELVLAFVQQDRHGTLTLIEEAGDLFRADQIGRNAGGQRIGRSRLDRLGSSVSQHEIAHHQLEFRRDGEGRHGDVERLLFAE